MGAVAVDSGYASHDHAHHNLAFRCLVVMPCKNPHENDHDGEGAVRGDEVIADVGRGGGYAQ